MKVSNGIQLVAFSFFLTFFIFKRSFWIFGFLLLALLGFWDIFFYFLMFLMNFEMAELLLEKKNDELEELLDEDWRWFVIYSVRFFLGVIMCLRRRCHGDLLVWLPLQLRERKTPTVNWLGKQEIRYSFQWIDGHQPMHVINWKCRWFSIFGHGLLLLAPLLFATSQFWWDSSEPPFHSPPSSLQYSLRYWR